MTNEQRTAKMQELRAKAEILVLSYNDGFQNGEFNPTMEIEQDGEKKTVLIAEILEQVINEYTSLAREFCFEECKSTDDPMLEAIKRLTFTTIGVKVSKKGDEKIPVSEIIEKDRAIDLLKLHKSVEGGIGQDAKWNGMVEKMNYHMTIRQAKRLIGNKETLKDVCKEIRDCYAMCKIAQEIELGKDPTSNTKLLATLQGIVTAMIGEQYKCTSHDVNYLTDLYASKGKTALSVNCANHRYFRAYIAAICHRIVTGEDYEVSFRKANTK